LFVTGASSALSSTLLGRPLDKIDKHDKADKTDSSSRD
jgi:hypothetical protein